MRTILARCRKEGRIVSTCYGIDLAVVRPTPSGHLVRIERDFVDDKALLSMAIKQNDGSTLEFFEVGRNLVVA